MEYTDFQNTMTANVPNEEWPETLKSLWNDAKGDWNAAHEIVDGMNTPTAKWIHAYLHRKEGDDWNAGYWYRHAGKPFPEISLEEEFQEIVEFVLVGTD